jgi:hypothetical protein
VRIFVTNRILVGSDDDRRTSWEIDLARFCNPQTSDWDSDVLSSHYPIAARYHHFKAP